MKKKLLVLVVAILTCIVAVSMVACKGLKIDCSDDAMTGVQKAVAEAIAKKTASSTKDLKMKSNTVIRAEVRKIDGKMRFTLLQINEEYNGKLTIFKAECKSTYYNEFSYDKGIGTATDTDLYGLAD